MGSLFAGLRASGSRILSISSLNAFSSEYIDQLLDGFDNPSEVHHRTSALNNHPSMFTEAIKPLHYLGCAHAEQPPVGMVAKRGICDAGFVKLPCQHGGALVGHPVVNDLFFRSCHLAKKTYIPQKPEHAARDPDRDLLRPLV